MKFDPILVRVFAGVLGVLIAGSVVGAILARKRPGPVVTNLNDRVRGWWVMAVIFALAIALGHIGTTVLFALISFLGLREFITLTPSTRGDHRALFWAFFVILPLQYYLVGTQWYGLFAVFIPVYAFLWVPVRIALAGETTRFLERTSEIQWGLMVCVYCVSHTPMLLTLDLRGFQADPALPLLFCVIVVQASDVFQYVWGRLCGRHKVVPQLSPSKTWEGLIGGVATATVLGAALWRLTPFTPLEAAAIALLISLMGFFGGLVMSAIKRDRGVKDYGASIAGHGGIMDRIDSLCFAAPVYFHVLRYWWG